MRILPITISADLIPPTLDGTKQRTRRHANIPITTEKVELKYSIRDEILACWDPNYATNSPWEKGDILYVREEHFAYGYWKPDGYTAGGRPKWKFKACAPPSTHEKDFFFPTDKLHLAMHQIRKQFCGLGGYYKRLARFMPKKYARIFLEVTDVRVERLHDITAAEAVLEGIEFIYIDGLSAGWKNYQDDRVTGGPVDSFASLWHKINGPGAWMANPWVWVVSFKQVEKPANFLTSKK